MIHLQSGRYLESNLGSVEMLLLLWFSQETN